VLLVTVTSAAASTLGLLASDSAASNPTSLAQEYAKQIPVLGPLMGAELLREHIRKDLMPRLMETQDDRTAYELGLNIFQKLSKHSPSLLELSNKVGKGEKLKKHEALDLKESNTDISRDMELLQEKIKEASSSNAVSHQTLKLVANSAEGYACAFKATEIAILSEGAETKKDCVMPFPGSFIMLDQKITVPAKLNLAMPPVEDATHLKPQEWMSKHMRRMLWCPDSFKKNGFDSDATCDAVSAALDMPTGDEIHDERESLAGIEKSQADGVAPPSAMVELGYLVQQEMPSASVMLQLDQEEQELKKEHEATELSASQRIMQQLEKNKLKALELKKQELQTTKKLALLQKKSTLRQMKERLAKDKSTLSKM